MERRALAREQRDEGLSSGGAVGKPGVKPELRTGELPPESDRGIHGETYGSAGALRGPISPASCRRPGAHCRPLDPASLSLSPLSEVKYIML
jgi:hypothetical protein